MQREMLREETEMRETGRDTDAERDAERGETETRGDRQRQRDAK